MKKKILENMAAAFFTFATVVGLTWGLIELIEWKNEEREKYINECITTLDQGRDFCEAQWFLESHGMNKDKKK